VSDLTRDLLDETIGDVEEAVAVLARERDHLRDQLHQVQAALDAQATHLRTLRALRALMAGERAPLAPRDVLADDDVLGVRIGPLTIAPGEAPEEGDLRLYLGTLRALQDALIHQIRITGDALEEHARRQRAADTPTGAFPAITPPGTAPAEDTDQQTEDDRG